MKYESCEVFKAAIENGKAPQAAFLNVLKDFLGSHKNTFPDSLYKDIISFSYKLEDRNFDFSFQSTIPRSQLANDDQKALLDEFRELIKLTMVEVVKRRANSPLIVDIQNTIAGTPDLKIMFDQMTRIENAWDDNLSPRHQQEIQSYLPVLSLAMNEAYSRMILQSASETELNENLVACFTTIPEKESGASKVFKEYMSQQEYLSKRKFFDRFYKMKSLAEKYEFLFNEYKQIQQDGALTYDLSTTLMNLYKTIVDSAYEPVDRLKYRLAAQQDAIIDDVFERLERYIQTKWAAYINTHLLGHLLKKFSEERLSYEKWGLVRNMILPEDQKDIIPLMSHVHCFKFSKSSNQSPDQLLDRLNKVLATQSPKEEAEEPKSISNDAAPSLITTYRMSKSEVLDHDKSTLESDSSEVEGAAKAGESVPARNRRRSILYTDKKL